MRMRQVLGHRDRFDTIAEQLARGENVVLLANHQTEADPAVSCPLLNLSVSQDRCCLAPCVPRSRLLRIRLPMRCRTSAHAFTLAVKPKSAIFIFLRIHAPSLPRRCGRCCWRRRTRGWRRTWCTWRVTVWSRTRCASPSLWAATCSASTGAHVPGCVALTPSIRA